MMKPSLSMFTVLALLVGILDVHGQVYTTTLPWAEGDTIVVSQSTNALGATVAIQTLSTLITSRVGAVVPTTALTTARTVTSIPGIINTPVVTTTSTTPIPVVPTTAVPVVPVVVTTPVAVVTTTRRTTSALAIVASPTTYASGVLVPVSSGVIMNPSDYQASVNGALQSGGANPLLASGNGAAMKGSAMTSGALVAVGGMIAGMAWMA